MKKIKKVIFVCMDNVCRSPMAEAIMKNLNDDPELEIESRGIVVLFPEPFNPKIRPLLFGAGIILENRKSRQLATEDFSEDTLILTMDRDEKEKILNDFSECKNVYSLMEFDGENGDIMDPYGGELEIYNMFFESLMTWVSKANEKIKKINLQEELI